MENLKRRFQEISGGKILDVGTGRGEFINLLKEFLKDYKEIIGIDNSDRSIEFCKNHFKDENISFLKMDGENMSFPDESFDTVCISNSLHHLPNFDNLLQEMKRVLKPKGLLIISEMFSDNQTNEQLSHVKLHHFSANIDSVLGLCHNQTFKREKLVNVANSLNLKDLEIFDYAYVSDNPKDKETIDYLIDTIDKITDRTKDYNDYDKYKDEGESIKQWIRDYGFQSATEIMILGKK